MSLYNYWLHNTPTLLTKEENRSLHLVHDNKTSFYSIMVSSSATYKELFHNMTTLLGKTNKPSLPAVRDFPTISKHFQWLFQQQKSSLFERDFRVWHRRMTTVSSHSLAPHFSPLHRFLNNLLQILSFRPSSRLQYHPIPTKRLYKTLEVIVPTITSILNESLTSGTVPPDFNPAVVNPLLKKPSLDANELKIYRPICNHLSGKISGKTCSSTTCLASVNTQSAQLSSVCSPVRAQHGDCSSPHTQRSFYFPRWQQNFDSLAFGSLCSLE